MRLTWLHFFSWIWMTPFPCNTIVQPLNPVWNTTPSKPEVNILRDDDFQGIERNEVVDELSPMISCLEVIARRWFINKERVPLLIPNFLEIPRLSKAFITTLHNEVATFSVAENFSIFRDYQSSYSAVIVVRNSKDFNTLNGLNKLCGPRCRYVVCFLRKFSRTTYFLREASTVVKALWKMSIINAVIVASVSREYLLAGTHSFESNAYSVPKSPEIQGKCSTLATKPDTQIFRKLLMNNALVKVMTSDCLPYAKIVEENNNAVITGVEGNMFESIARVLNMSLDRLHINFSMDSSESVYETLVTAVNNSEDSDIAFCGLYWDIYGGVEYSITFGSEEIVWLVPSISSLSLLGLVTPLQNSVWFAVIGLLVFAGIMKVLLFRKMSFLSLVGLILGIALPRQPRRLSNRIQFICWVLFGYVITQSYLASMAGQLMNMNYYTIETMEELVNSGISYGGTDRHKNIFKDDGNSISSIIYQHYQILNTTEYYALMGAIWARKNNSIAIVDELEISYPKTRPGPYDPHSLAESLASFPVAFATWKGLPYLDQINDRVSWIREAGFVAYWSEKYINISSSMTEKNAAKGLDMLHLSPSFLMLLLGHGLSIIVFFAEIGVFTKKYHLDLRRRNKASKK